MKIRNYEAQDYPRIASLLEAQGLDYQLPNINHPLFLVKKVLEDEDGNVQLAAGLQLITEAYLWGNPDWSTPRARWEALLALHEEVRTAAQDTGIEDTVLWMPPELDKSFGRRLKKLGWDKDRPWPTYSRKVDKG